MISRRRFIGQKSNDNYVELEYIGGNGTQYIDTGIIPGKLNNCNLIITAKCDTRKAFLFGCRNSTTGDNQGRFAYYPAELEVGSPTNPQYGNTNYIRYTNAIMLSQKFTIQFGTDGFWQIGVDYNDQQKNTKICNLSGSPTNDYSIFLLSCNTSGARSQPCLTARIYGCQIYSHGAKGQKIMDLIPVLDSNKVPCFYDKISNEFLYNKGTGKFLYAYKERSD